MVNGDDILHFSAVQKELKANGVFLTVDNSHGDTRGSFIVCDNKNRTKWRSLISHDNSCPIGSFDSIQEARAFAIGLSVGKNKTWKYS